MKILIVDDDAMVAEALGDILLTLGHEVFRASHGEEALSLCGRVPVELVIMDLELPGMPGTEAARRLASQHPSIGVLFSSGYSEQEGKIDLQAQYFRGFIRKPFEIADIKAAIEKGGC